MYFIGLLCALMLTRESLAIEVGQSMKGEDVVRVLNRLKQERGVPKVLFCDNGPEFAGQMMDLWAYRNEVKIDFLRDMPRFEMAGLPSEIDVSHWKFLGEGIVRSRIKSSLRESIGSLLKDELHLYGMTLGQWSEQIVSQLQDLVNSYADAYRAQLHRIAGVPDTGANPAQLQGDLEMLNHWSSTRAVDLADVLA